MIYDWLFGIDEVARARRNLVAKIKGIIKSIPFEDWKCESGSHIPEVRMFTYYLVAEHEDTIIKLKELLCGGPFGHSYYAVQAIRAANEEIKERQKKVAEYQHLQSVVTGW